LLAEFYSCIISQILVDILLAVSIVICDYVHRLSLVACLLSSELYIGVLTVLYAS